MDGIFSHVVHLEIDGKLNFGTLITKQVFLNMYRLYFNSKKMTKI